MRLLRVAVYGLRFLVELGALVALGYWGVRTGSDTLSRVALGLAAPLFAAGVWGTFVAPKARHRLPGLPRLAVELLVFGAAALALVAAARPVAAGVLVGAALATSTGAFLLERGDTAPGDGLTPPFRR